MTFQKLGGRSRHFAQPSSPISHRLAAADALPRGDRKGCGVAAHAARAPASLSGAPHRSLRGASSECDAQSIRRAAVRQSVRQSLVLTRGPLRSAAEFAAKVRVAADSERPRDTGLLQQKRRGRDSNSRYATKT
jgi:hypothetical protein